MAEQLSGGRRSAGSSDALGDLDRDVETELFDQEVQPKRQDTDLDARLAELKRRMGER
jgi:hypothetical protein